jgi:hypothetical protein
VDKGTTGDARVHIDAKPAELYDLVTDVTRMGEWSPECVRCVWLDGATGPAVGARFRGSNRRASLPFYVRLSDGLSMGVKDRKADLEQGMSETLDRIRAVAEQAS